MENNQVVIHGNVFRTLPSKSVDRRIDFEWLNEPVLFTENMSIELYGEHAGNIFFYILM